MPKYLILSPSGVPITGDTLFDVVFASSLLRPDYAARCVSINGAPDTVSFSGDSHTGYHGDELNREMAARGLTLLTRRGYQLFTAHDAR